MEDGDELLIPVQYSNSSHAAILDILPRVLNEWVASATSPADRALDTVDALRFQGTVPPPLTVEAYVFRIAKLTKCSAICFLVAYVYLERIVEDHGVLVTSLSIHRCASWPPRSRLRHRLSSPHAAPRLIALPCSRSAATVVAP